MRTRVIWILVAAVACGVAYLAGYWPERGQRLAAEGQVEALQTKLTLADAHVRTGALLGRVLTIRDLELELRSALGYEMPPATGATP